MKLSLLFFRRYWKLYSKHFLYILLSILIVSAPTIGRAISDKIAIASFLNNQDVDLEISNALELDYSGTNISDLDAVILELSDHSEQWNNYFLDYFLLLLSDYKVNNLAFTIGIDFSVDSVNLKDANFPLNQLDYFNNNVSLENFLANSEMPFGVSLVFSYDFFQTLNLSDLKIVSEVSYIGYGIDFNTKKIKSPEFYLKFIEELVEKLDIYLSSNDIPLADSYGETPSHIESIIFYKSQFDSLILLVSLVTLVITIWLSEFFSDNFTIEIRRKMDKLFVRGLEHRRERIISVYIPLIVDLSAFLFVGIVLFVANIILSLNLLLTIIIIGVFLILLFYRNYKKYSNKDQMMLNSKSTILFVLILVIVSLAPLLLTEFLYALIPTAVLSYIVLFSQVTQYFIVALLIAELFIKMFAAKLFSKFGIQNLINKLFTKKEFVYRQVLHTTLLLVWGSTVVIGGFQTFSTNYNLNFEMDYPTDLVVSTDVYLSNISSIQNNNNFSSVIPISYTQESFFLSYDLYLMNFTVIQEFMPDLKKYYGLSELTEGITYMSKDFAKEFNFVDGDYFPTKMGENGSSVFIDREIKVIDYFPFVKKIDDKPFIVSSYYLQYKNISKVSKLYLNFENDVNKIEVLNYLEKELESFVQEIDSPIYVNYIVFTSVFLAYFMLITLIVIWFCIKQLLVTIKTSMKTFHQRGMSIWLIKKRQFNNLAPVLLLFVILGVSLGILYLFLQLSTAVYPLSQYYPIQINFWISLLIIPIIPVLYGLTIITQRKSLFSNNTS